MNLNADLGESWYDHTVCNDEELMPLLDSCNIACGFHGGDALTLQQTIALALQHNVSIGAHPSFPDRKNFGRQRMQLPIDRLMALLEYQISALQGMALAQGARLHHIKPHGALYHYLNEVPAAATGLMRIAKKSGIDLIYGPSEGALRAAAAGAGLRYWSEGFADRRYEYTPPVPHPFTAVPASPPLHLRSRQKKDATLDTPAAVNQVHQILTTKTVTAADGQSYPLEVQTICIHGDHPGAVARAQAIRTLLDQLSNNG